MKIDKNLSKNTNLSKNLKLNSKLLFAIFLFIMLIAIPNTFALNENANTNYSMTLSPTVKSAGVGDSFELTLWGNTPKVSAIQSKFNYDTAMLELTDIELGTIADTASSKRAEVSSSLITMLWFDPSTAPEGYYKIATLSFKVLKGGNTSIVPRNYEFSDNTGVSITPVINKANISVSEGMKAELIINKATPNVDNEAVLKIYGIDASNPNLGNISGSFNFNNDGNDNVEIIGNYDIKVANSQYNYYIIDNSKNSFLISLKNTSDDEYDKSYTYSEIISIPLKLNNPIDDLKSVITYNVSVGNTPIGNKSVSYAGGVIVDDKPYFAVVPASSSTAVSSTDLTFCQYEKFRLKAYNMEDNNLTKFSGYIYVDENKFSADEFKISQFSEVYEKVNYSKLEINESYLIYNITLEKGIEEDDYSVLEFRLTPASNQNSSAPLILGNFSVSNNESVVNVDLEDITINIFEKDANVAPTISAGYVISDNNYVSFLPFPYDPDDDIDDLDYEWKFGDDEESTTEEPSHRYDYGQYSVSCTVEDKLNATGNMQGYLVLKEYNVLNYTIEKVNNSFALADNNNNNNTNSNDNINDNNSENTNITYLATFELYNPLCADVSAFVSFKNPSAYKVIENSAITKSSKEVMIPANESRNLTMIITSSSNKPFDLKFDVRYYPSSKTQDEEFYLQYYEWNFVEKSLEGVISSLSSSSNYRDINLGNQEMTFKVNKIPEVKEYEITKKIEVISPNSVVLYMILTVISFAVGLSSVIVVKKPKNRRILRYHAFRNLRKIFNHFRRY
ncbi:cohesin domain-containing protein [Methanococcus voltae]|uniref:Cellulosome anchoring protein cohesin region n=1 Tax=Methanococcus voltae (strain ATCC BAA-1334 / A3) TaxID=456320 RepID=D7DTN8_METV3|nr:cohesin domain-containing protein [Methanococcus voltae]MCS3901352.1 hypothetical protein [Methanococcus voltae]